MDAGVISTRYARAIYAFAVEKKQETDLYKAMKTLATSFSAYPILRKVMDDPTVSGEEKIAVLLTASGEKSDIVRQAVCLIVENSRESFMENIALMYAEVYRQAKGQVIVNLTTVDPADEKMKKELIPVIAQATGKQVEYHTATNPDLIGGFILEIEDQRLDASVKNQLRVIENAYK
ncbi:ATP synthase subunit delta [Bacteroidia bacterium]|nr:ATP synthase subunit delta [Bacteroidia bacterium]